MNLHRFLNAVEDPPDRRCFIGARKGGDIAVRHQVDVHLGSPPTDRLRKRCAQVSRRRSWPLSKLNLLQEDLTQSRYVVLRVEPESVANHDCLQVVVEHGCEDSVLEAADDDWFVDERVLDTAQSS